MIHCYKGNCIYHYILHIQYNYACRQCGQSMLFISLIDLCDHIIYLLITGILLSGIQCMGINYMDVGMAFTKQWLIYVCCLFLR